ncbi:hypothetical protein HUG10_21355 (plasmid) [Halorarum halophilum]|uniref:Uncharacterized protein n=1 Tax=Halorarum halophilum TaxID=2743090 RepID=A0A7D5KGV8_9EURY|nr:hypothetical protein [Halobaculum halophilum]QLG30137.1 hypothetical protein HUG10_21355 [Halobaculum halophilum]
MAPRMKDVASVVLVGALTAVWLHQTLTPGVEVDFAVKTLVLTFAMAGGITLFGKGTVQAAREFVGNGSSNDE